MNQEKIEEIIEKHLRIAEKYKHIFYTRWAKNIKEKESWDSYRRWECRVSAIKLLGRDLVPENSPLYKRLED